MYLSEENRRIFEQFVGEMYLYGSKLEDKEIKTEDEETFLELLDEYGMKLFEMGEE